MDIDLLTKDKVITEKFIIEPQYLDNPQDRIIEQIKERIEGYRNRQGFVLKFNKILSMHDLISIRDSLKGEYSIDCNLLVDVLSINVGNMLLNCKIKMVTDTGILATALNDKIQIFIPTDELMDGFQTIYKKNGSINIEIIGVRDIIYDNNIIISGKLLTHKALSRRLFLYKLNGNISALDFEGGEEESLNVLKKMPAKENKLAHEVLGYPTGKQLDLFRLISSNKFTIKQINEVNPYSKIKFPLNDAPLYEIQSVFKLLTKNVKKINNKELLKILSKVSISSKNVDLAYYKIDSQDDMKDILLNLKSNNAKNIIINTNPLHNLFRAEWTFLLGQIFDKLWIYRPICISPLQLDCVYLIGIGSDISKIPNIGKIGKNASKLFDGDLPEAFISTLRTFNEQLYQLYLEYGIRLIQNPDFINDPIVINSQTELSTKWELMTKIS